jgi:hypothetical protein
MQHGMYVDDMIRVHPDVLAEHYGVHSPAIRHAFGQIEAGHLEDEDNEDNKNHSLDGNVSANEADNPQEILNQNNHNFNNEVEVPNSMNPFANAEDKAIFRQALEMVHDVVPAGYGLLPEEWDDEGYPAIETLSIGKQSHKQIVVSLSDHI